MPKPVSTSAATPEDGGNRPIHTVRHRSIKATIWRNPTEKGPMYNVTVARSYRNGEEWRDSHSFGYDDLMNLAKVLSDAHTFITAYRDKELERQQPRRPERGAP